MGVYLSKNAISNLFRTAMILHNSLIILNILMIQIVLVEFLVKKLNSLMN